MSHIDKCKIGRYTDNVFNSEFFPRMMPRESVGSTIRKSASSRAARGIAMSARLICRAYPDSSHCLLKGCGSPSSRVVRGIAMFAVIICKEVM